MPWSYAFNPMDHFERPGDGRRIFLMGCIRYQDVAGRSYVSGFCYLWRGGDVLMAGGEGHTYTRAESARLIDER